MPWGIIMSVMTLVGTFLLVLIRESQHEPESSKTDYDAIAPAESAERRAA